MKAIVFGIKGQDGFYLERLLQENGITVLGVSRSEGNHIKGDIGDRAFVDQLIKQEQPAFIFHLAANSTTRHDVLFENHETISTGTLNLLEAVYKYSKHSRVFISGSGLQFVNKGLPISEKDPFEARDAYSITRIQSVYAARYFRSLGVQTYVGYFFNHDSPHRSERHVNQKIVVTAKRISAGSDEQLGLGNIEVKKEFTYAKDVVEAIWTFINNDHQFETVIGSGKAYSIADWLDLCFGYYKLDWKKHVVTNENFKAEYDILVSDPTTLFSLGWKQKTTISQLAEIMIENLHGESK